MVEVKSYTRLKKGVDGLMKVAVRDVEDEALRYELIKKLLEVVELLDGYRNN